MSSSPKGLPWCVTVTEIAPSRLLSLMAKQATTQRQFGLAFCKRTGRWNPNGDWLSDGVLVDGVQPSMTTNVAHTSDLSSIDWFGQTHPMGSLVEKLPPMPASGPSSTTSPVRNDLFDTRDALIHGESEEAGLTQHRQQRLRRCVHPDPRRRQRSRRLHNQDGDQVCHCPLHQQQVRRDGTLGPSLLRQP